MNKDKIKEISKLLKFTATDKVTDEIMSFADKLDSEFKFLKSIDTTGVEPMVRINDEPITFLREDTPTQALNKKELLNNSSEHDEDFIIINSSRGGEND